MENDNKKIILLQKLAGELSYIDYHFLDLEFYRPLLNEVTQKLVRLVNEHKKGDL